MARPDASSADAIGTRARAGLSAFKSSGVHVLDPYISPAARCAPAQGPADSRISPPPGQGAPGQGGGNSIWAGHIPADNVGFRLLRKAGWNVGTGLGVEEQGRHEPIEPVLPKGTRGLGFDSRSCTHQQQQQRHEQRAGRKRGAAGEPEAGEPKEGGRRSRTGTAAAAALIQEELAKESLSDKVAYHKQVMRTEREQARGRAIDAYLRSAFNDPFDHLHSDNSNPLSRPHKLTESNPLLDLIGD